MPIFNFLVQFLQNLLTFGTFWAPGEHCDVTGGTRLWKFSYSWVYHRIPHPKISLNANFQLPSPISSKFINIWHFLGPRGTLWRHRWYQVLKIFLFWVHHRIPHPKISLNANFQLPSPISSKFINIWHFLGPRGTLWRHRWYQVLKMFLFSEYTIEFPTPKLV